MIHLIIIKEQHRFRNCTDSKLDLPSPDPNSSQNVPPAEDRVTQPPVALSQVIEEIEEMMQNSPDPEEEEEALEEEDGAETSSQADSVLLQEMQALTQTFNNNWSYEGEGRGRARPGGTPAPGQALGTCVTVANRTSHPGSWQHPSCWGIRREGSTFWKIKMVKQSKEHDLIHEKPLQKVIITTAHVPPYSKTF